MSALPVETLWRDTEFCENEDFWFERERYAIRTGEFTMVGSITYNFVPKRVPWYRCEGCGREWSRLGCLDEECDSCDGWEQGITFLGYRPVEKQRFGA